MSKIAFIFPGPGRAEKAGMGKDFYEETSTGQERYLNRASELLGFSHAGAVLCGE